MIITISTPPFFPYSFSHRLFLYIKLTPLTPSLAVVRRLYSLVQINKYFLFIFFIYIIDEIIF